MSKQKNHKRQSRLPIVFGLAGSALFAALIYVLAKGKEIPLLDPKGFIADEQYRLLVISVGTMTAFATIVLFFIYFFAWRYRETNHKTVHDPKAGRSKAYLLLAWAAPISMFIMLAGLMIPATHKLEPQQAIKSDNKELTIRVVALRWKWVFLYPEQNIATVNYVQIPVDTPVRFELTADEAPMNGFWIPHLGGMLYAMTEHVNPLNLIAHTPGDYAGGASEVNGKGFAGMNFTTRVSSQAEFDEWVSTTQQAEDLDNAKYQALLTPSENTPAAAYASPTNQQIFAGILAKYTGSHSHDNTEHEGQH